ncbi:MAG: hypothetical protein Q7K55_00385 [Candidatus Levybacteria bacterium]|nr:hypothetical protein [Candidatus Levybacteria bacterium]
MKKIFGLIIILFFLSLPLIFSKPVSASDFWSTPLKISNLPNTNNALAPAITTDSRNYLHTAWMELCDTCEFKSSDTPSPGIFYNFWNGVQWSSPTKISKDLGLAELPTITTTNDNKIHIVWDEDSTANIYHYKMYYSSSSDGVSWSDPALISDSPDIPSDAPRWGAKMIADSNNNLHLVFTATGGNNNAAIYYMSYNGTSWSSPVKISENLDIQLPKIIIDSSNNIHVVGFDMRECPSGTPLENCPGGVYYIKKPSGGSWQPPVQLTKATLNFSPPQIISDSLGDLHVVYTNYQVPDESRVEYIRWNSVSGWSSPTVLTTTVADSYWWFPLVTISTDTNNNAYVGYGIQNASGGIDAVYKKWTRSTDSWSPEFFIRSTGYLEAPFIWKDNWQNQHFVWSEAAQNGGDGKWDFYYSVVPANVGSYNVSSALTINVAGTSDTLKIPASALASPATISAQLGPLPASFDNTFTTIRRSYTYRPSGTTFIAGREATATINYLDSELVGADERNLKVYIWDSTLNSGAGGWSTSFITSVNTGPNKATVTLPHFSVYGIAAPNIQTNFQNPTANYSGTTIPVSYQFINQVTNLTADPPAVRTILDPDNPDPITDMPTSIQFLDNYSVELVDSNNNIIQTLTYSENNQGPLTYDTQTNYYNGSFQETNLTEGDYIIKTYLGTINVGSFSFHFTPEVLPVFQVTFLPPLTTTDVYTMQDGSTLPFKFELTSGSVLTTQQNISVEVKGIPNTPTSSFSKPFSKNNSDISFDPTTGKYQLLLKTKELGMTTGEYIGEIFLNNNGSEISVGSIQFSIVNQGQAKGKSK